MEKEITHWDRYATVKAARDALKNLEGIPITFGLHDSVKALIGYLGDELDLIIEDSFK